MKSQNKPSLRRDFAVKEKERLIAAEARGWLMQPNGAQKSETENDATAPQIPLKQLCGAGAKEEYRRSMIQEFQRDIEVLQQVDLLEWSATYPTIYQMTLIAGRTTKEFQGINPWGDQSICVQLHNFWFMFYFIFSVFRPSQVNVSVAESAVLFVSVVVQSCFVCLLFLAEMRRWQSLHFFNPQVANA